jgi:hypothetical protein
MAILLGITGGILIAAIVWDAFEAVVLPRRVTRRVRLTRLFYRATWRVWSAIVRRIPSHTRRDTYLGFYGPLSLLLLLTLWAGGMVLGFAMLQAALGSRLIAPEKIATFGTDLYLSGTSFFTLGLGDVVPQSPLSRLITVVEAGMGFGFLALVIGYLPVLYSAFSRREASTVLLDARAGSPPSAGELLRRGGRGLAEELDHFLREWERWAAELLESHLSYPVLCYYRSQHSNQSWLAALTTILDAGALAMVGIEGISPRQGELTFAVARHAIVDLAQVLKTPPRVPRVDRLPAAELKRLREVLAGAGVTLQDGEAADRRLEELRRMYEPYLYAMADFLMMPLPPWLPVGGGYDNWQTSAWERMSVGRVTRATAAKFPDAHY